VPAFTLWWRRQFSGLNMQSTRGRRDEQIRCATEDGADVNISLSDMGLVLYCMHVRSCGERALTTCRSRIHGFYYIYG
jgi:hypothetical protein